MEQVHVIKHRSNYKLVHLTHTGEISGLLLNLSTSYWRILWCISAQKTYTAASTSMAAMLISLSIVDLYCH